MSTTALTKSKKLIASQSANGNHKKMKALVYYGAGKKSWEDKVMPTIQQPTDALVKITKTTICGTDLHILKGDVPEVKPGTTIGHEGVGIIEDRSR